ncbi:TRAP transporter small permease subunit [Ekhidna sp.]|uniref:TRAP transporter small permease subunit n=1 Tax=Ekhidna sp. TaxID=2608089 RepID=UPI003CCBE08D
MTLIDNINKTIGKASSWLTLVLVLVIVVDVILRYTLSITSAASFELEWHLFAAIFLLGAAYTLQQDKHVRVDVFYHRFSEKTKAWVNLVGTLLLLLPFCGVAFWESLSFVRSSFLLNETSPQPGGLPARWIIKSTIPAGFFLLALQGVSLTLKSLVIITHGKAKSN